jgi:hypothetical protein
MTNRDKTHQRIQSSVNSGPMNLSISLEMHEANVEVLYDALFHYQNSTVQQLPERSFDK